MIRHAAILGVIATGLLSLDASPQDGRQQRPSAKQADGEQAPRPLMLVQLARERLEPEAPPGPLVPPEITIFDFVVSPAMLPAIERLLDLNEEQQAVVEALHADYWDRIVALHAQTRERGLGAGYAEYLEMGRQQRERHRQKEREAGQWLPFDYDFGDDVWAEMARLVRQGEAEYILGKREADQMLAGFLDDVFAVIADRPESERIELRRAVERLLRRWNWRPDRLGSHNFRDGIDAFLLVAQASTPDGELAPLNSNDSLAEDVARALGDYERRLDAFLQSELARNRRQPETTTDLRIFPGTPEAQAKARRWSREYDATRAAVDRIALALKEHIGDEARARWMDRYFMMLCPEATVRRAPDVIMSNLERMFAPTEVQRKQIEAAYEQYRVEREAIVRDFIRTGVDLKHRYGFIYNTKDDQLDLARLQLKEKALIKRTLDRFASILDASQQAKLDEFIVDARRYRGELLRPPIFSNALEALQSKGEIDENENS